MKKYTYKVQWNDLGMFVDRSDGSVCWFKKRRETDELNKMSEAEMLATLVPTQGFTKFKKFR